MFFAVNGVESATLYSLNALRISREINTALVEDLRVGDYVVLHVGYALSKLDEDEALETLRLMEQAGLLEGE